MIGKHFARGVAHCTTGDPSEHAQLDASGEENLFKVSNKISSVSPSPLDLGLDG